MQEQQWFKAVKEESKINVCDLTGKSKSKSKGRRIVIYENWDISNCAIYDYGLRSTFDKITWQNTRASFLDWMDAKYYWYHRMTG